MVSASRVSRWTGRVARAPVTMMSGCRPTNSCASTRIRLMSSPPPRRSIRTLRPSVQPKPASACVNAETRSLRQGSGFVDWHEQTDAPHAVALLRPRRQRPCCRCATQQCDELAAFHGLPSSGREPHITTPSRDNAGCSAAKWIVEWQSWVTPGPPPWPSHVRFRRVQTWPVKQAAQFCFA